MELFILLIIIIAISTFKSEVDKSKTKNKKHKNIFDEMKKEIIKQKKVILHDANTDKAYRSATTAQTKVKEIKTIDNNSINDYYKDTYREDNSIVVDLLNNNLEAEDYFDLKKDLKINPKRAFIYSEIFNRRY